MNGEPSNEKPRMKITEAEYIISAVSAKQYPPENEPEFVLAGRSNVGKSSLINKIVNRKSLARTSSQPGKTQTLNFYHINKAWYFVDLPGYGYARISKEIRATWAKFINDYLELRRQIAGIILIVDIRHTPSADDRALFEWLGHSNIPFLVVATKADKISRGQWSKHKLMIQKGLNTDPEVPVVVFSTQSGVGLAELDSWIEGRIADYLEFTKEPDNHLYADQHILKKE